MQPARFRRLVRVAPQARDGHPPRRTGHHRLPYPIVHLGIANAHSRVDRHHRDDARGERTGIVLCREEHEALAERRAHRGHRGRQRQHHPSAGREGVEPAVERMRDAGVHEDRVERFAERRGRVAMARVDPRTRREISPRLARQRLVHFEREHASRGADALAHHRRVVAEAAANVQHARATRELERVDPDADRPGLPVEQLARGIDGDGDVVVHPRRIGVRRRARALRPRSDGEIQVAVGEHGPRARRQKPLARHRGEGVD